MDLENIFDVEPYKLGKKEKQALLVKHLNILMVIRTEVELLIIKIKFILQLVIIIIGKSLKM